MFTLGYLPIIALFIYILVILGIKCILFSLYKYETAELKGNIKEKEKENKNKKEEKNKKAEIKENKVLNILNVAKNTCMDMCNVIKNTYMEYINIFSLILLTLVIGVFTYTIYTRMLEKTYLSYLDMTDDNVYSLDNKLKDEIKKLDKGVTDITIKYSVYPFKDELSKKQQEDIAKASGTTTTYSNGQTQNTSPIIQDSRYNVETRVYNIIDVVSKQISKTNNRIKYELIENSDKIKLSIEYTKNDKKNVYNVDLSTIIFQNFNDYNIYTRLQEIYTDFFKNINMGDNTYTYGLIEEDKNILKREELAPIIDTTVGNDMFLELITQDMFNDISIDKYKTIIIPARKEDISKELLDKLMQFKQDGGNFLFFKMPIQEKKEEFTNLDTLMAEYGITVPNNKLVLEQDNDHRYYIPEKAMGNNEKLIDNTVMIADTTSNTKVTTMYDTIKPVQKFITVTNGIILKDSEQELKAKKVTITDIAKTTVNAKTVDGYVKEEITADTVERGELRKRTSSGRSG